MRSVYVREESLPIIQQKYSDLQTMFLEKVCKMVDVPSDLVHHYYVMAETTKDRFLQGSVVKMKNEDRYYSVRGYSMLTPRSKYSTEEHSDFAAFFREKYGVVGCDMEQPLIEIYRYRLIRSLTTPQSTDQIDAKLVVKEMIDPIGMTESVFDTLHCMPSFIHLLRSYLLASQFRERWKLKLPLDDIRLALTPDDERFRKFELLGDSTLKLHAFIHIFRANLEPNHNEILSNANFHTKAMRAHWSSYMTRNRLSVKRFNPFQLPDPSIGELAIADSVEAMIGVCYNHGGLTESLRMCRKLKIPVYQTKYSTNLPDLSTLVSVIEDTSPLESALGYKFSNKGILIQSLIHSFPDNTSLTNRRLIFLGDALLYHIITEFIFQEHGALSLDEMTRIRATLMNRNQLAQICMQNSLHEHIYSLSWTNIDEEMSSRVASDLVKAIAGAILVDTKFKFQEAKAILLDFLSLGQVNGELSISSHPTSELGILANRHGLSLDYRFINDNDSFKCIAIVRGIEILECEGRGQTKKEARRDASARCLKHFEEHPEALVR